MMRQLTIETRARRAVPLFIVAQLCGGDPGA